MGEVDLCQIEDQGQGQGQEWDQGPDLVLH